MSVGADEESELIKLGVFLRLLVIAVEVFVYFRMRELVVVVPFRSPVVADAFDEVDDDDDAPVIFALGETDDDESKVTWAL